MVTPATDPVFWFRAIIRPGHQYAGREVWCRPITEDMWILAITFQHGVQPWLRAADLEFTGDSGVDCPMTPWDWFADAPLLAC